MSQQTPTPPEPRGDDDLAKVLAEEQSQRTREDAQDPQAALAKMALTDEQLSAELGNLNDTEGESAEEGKEAISEAEIASTLDSGPAAPVTSPASSSNAASTSYTPAGLRSRQALLERQQAANAMRTYRRVMFPALLVMGGLMSVVGLASFVFALGVLGNRGGLTFWLFTLVAFPLAAAMFFGAWHFHRDLHK